MKVIFRKTAIFHLENFIQIRILINFRKFKSYFINDYGKP